MQWRVSFVGIVHINVSNHSYELAWLEASIIQVLHELLEILICLHSISALRVRLIQSCQEISSPLQVLLGCHD